MIRLSTEQLRTFLTVVRLGGVGRAAEALNLTQPAVTSRIHNLENTLSGALFVRAARSVQLTKKGELLARYAEEFERLSDNLEKDIIAREDLEGDLRIGASETIVQCWLPELTSRLHDLYPRVRIELRVDVSENLRDSLLKNEIDLAILLGPVNSSAVCNIHLPAFEMTWYMAAGKISTDNPEQLYTTRPVITYAKNTRPYHVLKNALLERIGPNAILFPSSSLSACFRMVEANLGVGALPRLLGLPLVAAGTLEEFNPGWVPEPLHFTASYIDELPSHLIVTAANTALEVANAYAELFTRTETQ